MASNLRPFSYKIFTTDNERGGAGSESRVAGVVIGALVAL